jgi:hypothetical protein
MKTTKTKTKTKTAKTTKARTTKARTTRARTKTKRKSAVSRPRRDGNGANGQALSFDPPAKDVMPEQAQAAPRHRVRDSVDRVMAECDKVDAALIEMTRTTWDQDLPPLAIKEIDADEVEAATRGWVVVSGDPHRPLTERQAKHIVAAMRSQDATAPIGIGAGDGDVTLHIDELPR